MKGRHLPCICFANGRALESQNPATTCGLKCCHAFGLKPLRDILSDPYHVLLSRLNDEDRSPAADIEPLHSGKPEQTVEQASLWSWQDLLQFKEEGSLYGLQWTQQLQENTNQPCLKYIDILQPEATPALLLVVSNYKRLSRAVA